MSDDTPTNPEAALRALHDQIVADKIVTDMRDVQAVYWLGDQLGDRFGIPLDEGGDLRLPDGRVVYVTIHIGEEVLA